MTDKPVKTINVHQNSIDNLKNNPLCNKRGFQHLSKEEMTRITQLSQDKKRKKRHEAISFIEKLKIAEKHFTNKAKAKASLEAQDMLDEVGITVYKLYESLTSKQANTDKRLGLSILHEIFNRTEGTAVQTQKIETRELTGVLIDDNGDEVIEA